MTPNRGEEKKRIGIPLQPVAITVLFLSAIAGQFTLERINPEYASLGWIAEPRIILMGLLLIVSLPFIKRRGSEHRIQSSTDKSYVVVWLWLVFIFFMYLCITAVWSSQTADAREGVLSLMLLMALVFFAYVIARVDPPRTIDLFLKLFLYTAIIYAIGGLLGYSLWGQRGQLAFLWGGSNAYVRVVGTGAIISLYLWVKTRKSYWLACVPLLLLTAFLSGSRGGMFSLFVALILILLVLMPNIFRLSVALCILAICILLFMVAPMTGTYKEMIVARYPSNLEELSEAYEYSRAPWFSKSVEAFEESPTIGIGLEGLKGYGLTYAHNIVLNVAADGGVLGLILLIITFIPVVIRWFQKRTLDSNACFILGAFYLIASMFSGSYYDQRFMWLFLLFFMFPSSIEDSRARIYHTEQEGGTA